jgi:hypothetical protein
MIDDKLKEELNNIGAILAERLGEFYGKVSFNFQGGYVNTNIEVSIKPE